MTVLLFIVELSRTTPLHGLQHAVPFNSKKFLDLIISSTSYVTEQVSDDSRVATCTLTFVTKAFSGKKHNMNNNLLPFFLFFLNFNYLEYIFKVRVLFISLA